MADDTKFKPWRSKPCPYINENGICMAPRCTCRTMKSSKPWKEPDHD